MTLAIALLLGLIVVAMVLFSIDRIPPDAVALGVLLALILLRLVKPQDAFSGFGSDTVMMLLGLLILSAALGRTGVVDELGRMLLRFAGTSVRRLRFVSTSAVGLLSSVMSNTASTAVFVPIVTSLAGRARVSPSTLLMPVAFSSILASSMTLVSTSTNLVVSGLMTQHGLAPMSMFELTPVGFPILVVGVAYMLTLGSRLIPARAPVAGPGDDLVRFPFLTEVMVVTGSPLVGRTLAESRLGRDLDLTVLEIIREKVHHLPARAETRLQEGDVLLVEGERGDILRVKDRVGIEIKADAKLSDPSVTTDELRLVEAIVLDRSPLPGRTLKDLRFRERYGLQVLAINRHGESIRHKISQVPLRLGDVLLLQGRGHEIAALQDRGMFRIFSAIENDRPKSTHARIALGIFAAVLVAAGLELVALPVAVLLGALLVFATGCITPEEAYREMDWRILVLIGSMLGLGVAMNETGAAKYLAGLIAHTCADAGPVALLTGFFALTLLLTQPMSNQAAAVIVLPVAIQTATQLGLNPRSFAMMIAIAASCSYVTPLEPACLMVYGPGHYRFRDFIKVGGLLTLLVYAVAITLVPIVWPVHRP